MTGPSGRPGRLGRVLKRIGLILVGLAIAVWIGNSSWLSSPLESGGPRILAHRGLGQDFSREGLTGKTCTAARMIPSDHPWIENTIPSMRAAFELGAEAIELDVHPTTDGRFAVFHDWTIDCRTEGSGVTREQSLDFLQSLDVGHGYTADGGATFPFRGKGVGMLPSLDQVLAEFPDRRLLINVKSNDPREGEMLAERIGRLPAARQDQLMVYGGARPIAVLRDRLPALRVMSRRSLERCLIRYLALGWSGHVPASCERSLLMVPSNYAFLLWGWPNRFLRRMDAVGTFVFLMNDYEGGGFSQGLDRVEDLEKVPSGWSGWIWTDRIDRIAPALRR